MNMNKPSQRSSPWATAGRQLLRKKLAMLSLGFLLFVVTLSFLAPYITTADITRINTSEIGLKPSWDHWFGTDKNGRDVFTRTLYGGRVSLTIGILSTFFVTLIGTGIGASAGYFGGWVDSLLMRLTDFMMNFPFMVFAIVLNAILLGKLASAWSLVVVFSVLTWGGVARIVRSVILSEKENDYILAARAIGGRPMTIIVKHLLPNVMTTIIVQATLLLASYIVAEAALSFLGIGVPAHVPSWGNMLVEAREADVLRNKVWIWIPAAVCVSLTILAINFLGEGIKEAFNPKV